MIKVTVTVFHREPIFILYGDKEELSVLYMDKNYGIKFLINIYMDKDVFNVSLKR